MKYCPICDMRFDEEIIRFCTKDGTPLIEEAEPKFTELPSENIETEEDDIGEITMNRRKDVPAPPPNLDEGLPEVKPAGQRIVIPTTNEPDPVTPSCSSTPASWPFVPASLLVARVVLASAAAPPGSGAANSTWSWATEAVIGMPPSQP